MDNLNIDVGQDANGEFHFIAYQPGVKNARRDARSLCGLFSRDELRSQAWFDIGDTRGRVYHERAHEGCAERLEV